MQKFMLSILLLAVMFLSVSCATIPEDRYNTQKGAVIGAGIGALLGQAIGHDTEGTLLGAGIGTVIGAIAGNAVDQEYQAARDAAMLNKRVVYVDDQGRAVEAIPVQNSQQTNCRKVTTRHWDNGQLISETIEEICEGEKRTQDY
jgi:outer membrane lipoprotein SlyB